ncbi:MAG: hypothetical protein HY319_31165 [Armatimonadetes bacterium]|nr:hypothetical protein [Armatimonadota bacterium]
MRNNTPRVASGGPWETSCFFGIQPSGAIHIGNYAGAIRTWVRLQEEMECIFGLRCARQSLASPAGGMPAPERFGPTGNRVILWRASSMNWTRTGSKTG